MSEMIRAAIVRVRRESDQQVVGVGFLMDAGKKTILTCAHVINAAIEDSENQDKPRSLINLDFPFIDPNKRLDARVTHFFPKKSDNLGDIAVLEVLDILPVAARSVHLIQSNTYNNHEFGVYGFPMGFEDSGQYVEGKLQEKLANKRIQAVGSTNLGYFVDQGFSGSPVYDKEIDAVIGMMMQIDSDSEKRIAIISGFEAIESLYPLQMTHILQGSKPFHSVNLPPNEDIDDLFPGHNLENRYQIIDRIGYGWLSLYYKALQVSTEREVIVKILRPHITDTDLRAIFQKSIQVMTHLKHQQIVPVYDAGIYNQRPYMIMRYVSRGSLQRLIDDQRTVSLSEKLRILHDVAEALDYAHGKGVFHGDIKPQNLQLDERDRVYIIDFEPYISVRMINVLLQRTNSYKYMSPERLNDQALLPQSDVYSLAVTAYILLTGKLPFDSDSRDENIRLRQLRPLALPDILKYDEPTQNIFRKALNYFPEDRPQSATEFVSTLEDSLASNVSKQTQTVFLSYSRKDIGVAQQIVEDLEENGVSVWFDKSSINPATYFPNEIEKGIKESDKFIVILSPDSVASSFVTNEILFALDNGKTVIPVLYRPCSRPVFIYSLQYIDFADLGYSRGLDLLLRSILSK